MSRLEAVVALAALAALAPAAAWACGSCACGTPVLTSMGTEPPLAGRVRVATAVRAWSDTEVSTQLRELRFDLLASWAPSARWALLVALPLQLRELTPPTLARERAFGLGDAEVQGRWVFLLDERMRPRWVVGLNAGVRLPTAPVLSDAKGVVLSSDAQPGAGGFTALAGLGYSGFFHERVSAHAALQLEAPLTARSPWAGRAYAGAQYQPWTWLGVRAGLEGRAQLERAEMPGGVTLYAAPDVLVQLPFELTLLAGARIPFLETRPGAQPGPVLMSSLVVDL